MHFWIFCLIFTSDYDKVLRKSIYILLNDMHFSDILSDFSLNYYKVKDYLFSSNC